MREPKRYAIIPAGGKSTRFIGDSPKMMRTHPDGQLMLQKAINTFEGLGVEKVYLIVTAELVNTFDLKIKLEQAFGEFLEIVTLTKQTNSSVETVLKGIELLGNNISLHDQVFIKDVDNLVEIDKTDFDFDTSGTVGINLNTSEIKRVSNKSFIKHDNGIVIDFVEKQIISEIISVGTHYFKNISEFIIPAKELMSTISENVSELYISHVIAKSVYNGNIFKYYEAISYKDFGTQDDWEEERNNFKTFFCDFDGTLVKNIGKYGSRSWKDREDEGLEENLEIIKNLINKGGQLIITTSRPSTEREYILSFLKDKGINTYEVICGLNHSQRVLINDYYNTNLYPTAVAYNVKRNGNLNEFNLDR